MLTRYWFDFRLNEEHEFYWDLNKGVGVTASSREDAQNLIKEKILKSNLPKIIKVIENIDVSEIEDEGITMNMGVCSERGIWYPLGFE